jgi:hypothetical protein
VRYFLIQKFASVADDASDVPCQLVLQRLVSLFGLSDILEGEQWLGLITAVRTNTRGGIRHSHAFDLDSRMSC